MSGVPNIKVTMLFHDLAVPMLLSSKSVFSAERSIESLPMTLSDLEESETHSVIEVSDSVPFRCFACNLNRRENSSLQVKESPHVPALMNTV